MKRLSPLALAACFVLPAAASAQDLSATTSPRDTAAYFMGLNASLLRNGDNVWQRAREGFQLPDTDADIVRRHEAAYSARPESFRRMLDRSRPYLFHIMNEVERRGMPTEIAFLPLVESAFNAQAVSSAKAAGLWQFMPATGRHYGLEQTVWYDGRRDVLAATQAALDYLQNLYGMFGDWHLALAAYNWGEGNVGRALQKNRAKGLPEDFASIRMPNETRNYVPKLLAVRNILTDPSRFGVSLAAFPNKPHFVSVSTGKHMDLDVAAKLAEMPMDEFKVLNPAFNRPIYAHKPGRQLLIPAARAEAFEKNLANYTAPLMSWQPYTTQAGDTVETLAERFSMKADALRRVNGVAGSSLPQGQTLLVAQQGGSLAPIPYEVPTVALVEPARPDMRLDARPVSAVVAKASPAVTAPLPVAAATPAAPPVAPLVLAAAPVVTAPAAALPAAPLALALATPVAATATASPSPAPTLSADTVVTAAATAAPAATVSPTAPVLVAAAPSVPVPADAETASPASRPEATESAASAAPSTASAAPDVLGDEGTAVVAASAAPATVPAAAPVVAEAPSRTPPRVLLATASINAPAAVVATPAAPPKSSTPAATATPVVSRHVVKSGDTLYSLAKHYGVTPAELKTRNRLDSDALHLGQTLVLNGVSSPAAAPKEVRKEYVVQKGDTLFSIARKFNVEHSDLMKWNHDKQLARLMPGFKLTLRTH